MLLFLACGFTTSLYSSKSTQKEQSSTQLRSGRMEKRKQRLLSAGSRLNQRWIMVAAF